MSCAEIQKEIVAEFGELHEWEQKYRYLIKQGKSLLPFPEELKSEETTLLSCQTVIWHTAHLEDGRLVIQANSDAMQVRGLIALLLRVYSNQPPEEILNTPPDFIKDLGMDSLQSVNHSTGIDAFLDQIRTYAEQFSAQT